MEVDRKTKIMAAVCKFCPFCIAARKWPDSAYAKKLKKLEKNCLFCKAYSRLKQSEQNTSD